MRVELPILFAARLREILWIIVSAYDDFAVARVGHQRRDIKRERRVATLVFTDSRAVDPHRRGVIDSAEPEHQTLMGCHGWHLDVTSIPTSAIKPGIRDATRPRFG